MKTPIELVNLTEVVDKQFKSMKGLVSDNLKINAWLDDVVSDNNWLKSDVQTIEAELVSLSHLLIRALSVSSASSKSSISKLAVDKED